MKIDEATAGDFEQVLAIYNEVIRNTTAVYSEEEYDEALGRGWFDAKLCGGFPFIVARDERGIAGFAALGAFRAWPCYRYTVEHSVHVHADRRGRGIGRALVLELKSRAAGRGMHVMIAGIDTDNVASIRMHEGLGFSRAGHLRQVGFKFGRWLDLEFLECILPPPSAG